MLYFNFLPLFLTIFICYHLIPTCIGQAITFEQYENLQGKSFGTTKTENVYNTICDKIAELNNIRGYNKNYVIAERWDNEISLKKADGSVARPSPSEFLLHCRYEGPAVYKQEIRAWTGGFSYQRAVGKGINPNDVMEYKYNEGKAVPFMNRPNLLTEVGL